MNKKLYALFSIVAVLAFIATAALGPGPDFKHPKPEFSLSVCYVTKGDDVTGAKFGYMAENLPDHVLASQSITHPYLVPFGKPPVGADSAQIWSNVYPLKNITWDVNIWFVGNKHASINKHETVKEVKRAGSECPVKKYAPFVGISIPYVILYTSKSLMNGYGILVSTAPFASVGNIQAAFKLTAIPADLKEVCVGPVAQKYDGDTVGYWDCDPLLVGILPFGGNGGRYPLLGKPSLKNIYDVLTGAAPWTATP